MLLVRLNKSDEGHEAVGQELLSVCLFSFVSSSVDSPFGNGESHNDILIYSAINRWDSSGLLMF